MGKFFKTVIVIIIGIFMIPALYAMGVALFGTAIAFLANPKVMMVILGVFLVISLPGIVIGHLIRR